MSHLCDSSGWLKVVQVSGSSLLHSVTQGTWLVITLSSLTHIFRSHQKQEHAWETFMPGLEKTNITSTHIPFATIQSFGHIKL